LRCSSGRLQQRRKPRGQPVQSAAAPCGSPLCDNEPGDADSR
jgi:hypothetical protein